MTKAIASVNIDEIRVGDGIKVTTFEFGVRIERYGRVRRLDTYGPCAGEGGYLWHTTWAGKPDFELLYRPNPHAHAHAQDSYCASCYVGIDCGMCRTIAPPGETNTAGGCLLTSREEAASKAMLWAETMGRSSLDQMAAEGLAAADAILFSQAAIDAAVECGMETHDWEMFEAQAGDIAEAVADAIRAAVTAAMGGGE